MLQNFFFHIKESENRAGYRVENSLLTPFKNTKGVIERALKLYT